MCRPRVRVCVGTDNHHSAYHILRNLHLCTSYRILTNFSRVISLCAFCSLVAIPEALVRTPLVLAKGTMHIQTSAALLIPNSWQGSALHELSDKLDVFLMWKVILLALGIQAVFGLGTLKSWTIIGCLTILWILVSTTLGGLVQIT